MDEQVLRGIAKWPNVPAVYGWLALDRRGDWRLRGETITNPTVVAFVNRNYESDAEGRWFFQNGPQRVYVSLEATPFIYRVVSGAGAPLVLETHTGAGVASVHAWLADKGDLVLESEGRVGVVDDRDLATLLAAFVDANGNALSDDALENVTALVQAGRSAPVWLKLGDRSCKVEPVRFDELPSRFRFERTPQPGAA